MIDDTYYAVLGVSEAASESEIRAAYRNLLKKIHPDTVSTLSPEMKHLAEAATKEITEAYSVLSDSDKRRQYDHALAQRRRKAAADASIPSVSQGRLVRPETPPAASARHRYRHHHRRRNGRYSLRLRRWASKHPALAGSMACLLLLLALAIVIVIWAVVRASSA